MWNEEEFEECIANWANGEDSCQRERNEPDRATLHPIMCEVEYRRQSKSAIFEFPGQWGVWPMNVLPVHYTADSVQPEKNETCTGRRSVQYIQLSRHYSYSTVEIKAISNTLPFHEKRPLNLSRTWFRLCGKEGYWDWQDIMLFLPANATIRGNWQDAKCAALSSKNHELRPWAMSSSQLKSNT